VVVLAARLRERRRRKKKVFMVSIEVVCFGEMHR
jgi:hypothetical protein